MLELMTSTIIIRYPRLRLRYTCWQIKTRACSQELVSMKINCCQTSQNEHTSTNIISPQNTILSSEHSENEVINVTEFSNLQPLFACKHAFEKDHECKYVECFRCYKLPKNWL